MSNHPGILTLTVEFAQGLKDKLLVRRQDPYCIIRVGGQTVRTRTACKGGRDPVWNETFSFDVHHANELEVTIKDDKLLHDPTLGVACVSLSRVREHGSDRLTAEVICPHHHCQHGIISLVLAFKPHAHVLVAAAAPAYPSPPPPSAVQQGVPVPLPVPVHVPPPPPPATIVVPVPVYHAPPPPRVVMVDVCEPHHHHHHHGLFHHHGHHHHHHGLFHHHGHHHGHHHHHHWC